MIQSKIYARLLDFGDVFIRIVILQLLFILFTVLGFGVFGFFPAFIAMMATFRAYALKINNESVLKIFWTYFKNYFLKANLIGWLFSLVLVLILLSARYYNKLDAAFGGIMVIISYLALFFILLLVIYGLPLLIHLNTTLFQAIRGCILIAMIRPLHTIVIGLSMYIIFHFAIKQAFFMSFFAFGILAYLWIHVALNAFNGYVSEHVSE